AQRPPARSAAVAAAVSRSVLPRRQRARLLADRPHRLLGGDQPGLQSDALTVRVHVLRPGAALARVGAAACTSPRALPPLARRAGGRWSREHVARLSARKRGTPRRGDPPWAARGRTAARLRRQPRSLRRDLRPAGTG